jgi:hypothetical protein
MVEGETHDLLCGHSYDRDLRGDDTVAAAVVWAAKRARRFERARKGKKR